MSGCDANKDTIYTSANSQIYMETQYVEISRTGTKWYKFQNTDVGGESSIDEHIMKAVVLESVNRGCKVITGS